MTATPAISRASVGLRSERGPVLLAVMLSMCLVAIDSTILATAVPAVVGDLGGFSQFPWLFSVYLLAQAVTVPIYAKLADLYGRKPVMLVGIGIFVVGSLLCGLAWGMTSLIVFRALQGIGAGAVQPIGQTIIGDIYSVAERAKVQGYLASVWAVSAVLGPTLGGLFSDYLSWRFVFLVNLPVGIAAAVMFCRGFHENVERASTASTTPARCCSPRGPLLLLLGLLEGGVRWGWGSTTSVSIFATAALLLVAFVLVEPRAAEPVLPSWVFRHRVVVAAMITTLIVGVLMMGMTTYVPLYGQSVLGHGAVASGLALAAIALGWPLSASNSGRLYLTVGFRTTMLIGGAVGLPGRSCCSSSAGTLDPAAGPAVLRDGPGLRPGREPGDHRRPVRRVVAAARRRDRRHDVLPLDRQRGRCRDLRRDRQRLGPASSAASPTSSTCRRRARARDPRGVRGVRGRRGRAARGRAPDAAADRGPPTAEGSPNLACGRAPARR